MSESRHTPGEWRANGQAVLESRGMTVAWCLIDSRMKDVNSTTYIGPNEAEANARAIAALPALLEALEEVMSWIKNWDPRFVEDDEWPETQAKIDAALAASKGGA